MSVGAAAVSTEAKVSPSALRLCNRTLFFIDAACTGREVFPLIVAVVLVAMVGVWEVGWSVTLLLF